MSIVEDIRANQRILLVAALGFIAAAEFGYTVYPWEIEGSGVVATAGIVAGIAGYVAAGKISELFPEPEGIFIVEFEASDDTGGRVWELSEDQFTDMETHGGSLFEWPVGKRVYECKEYHPEENKAVGNWRESVAGSQLAGDCKVADAMIAIEELRDEFEPEAQRSRYLQRRLKSIARRVDRQRLKDQQEILDPTVTPSFDEETRATVSEIVDESIPDELQPDPVETGHVEEEPETIGFELLDESEPLDEET